MAVRQTLFVVFERSGRKYCLGGKERVILLWHEYHFSYALCKGKVQVNVFRLKPRL